MLINMAHFVSSLITLNICKKLNHFLFIYIENVPIICAMGINMHVFIIHASINLWNLSVYTLCNGVCGKTFKTMQKKRSYSLQGSYEEGGGYLQMLIFTDKDIYVAMLAVLFQHRHYICTYMYYESTKNIIIKNHQNWKLDTQTMFNVSCKYIE